MGAIKETRERQRHDLAIAAGADEADRQMRAAGRTSWTREDYNAAVREYERVDPQAGEGSFAVTNDRAYTEPQVFDNEKDAERYARVLNDRHPDAHAKVVLVSASARARAYRRDLPGTAAARGAIQDRSGPYVYGRRRRR